MPELMAIGDSIFNGVRSMTMTRQLAAVSAPALAARQMGMPLSVPDYPREVLFDLEALARNPFDVLRFKQQIVDNARAWWSGNAPWSNQKDFDNIAVAAADIDDMWSLRYDDFAVVAPGLIDYIEQNAGLGQDVITAIDQLWKATNFAFVLNPTRDPAQGQETPLDILARRQPTRLLVNLGANNGIVKLCVDADADEAHMKPIREIPGLMADLAARLPTTLKAVYVNSLPKPSTVANLWTRMDWEEMPPGCGKYYKKYVGRLGAVGGISGAEMASVDKEVAAINKEIERQMRRQLPRNVTLRMVDIYGATACYDDKHGCECVAPGCNCKPIFVNKGGTRWHLTNLPLEVLVGFMHGGLFGLDNMHPTTIGYALMANKIMQAVAQDVPNVWKPIDPQEAFELDTLMQNLPGSQSVVNFMFAFLRQFVAQERNPAAVLQALKARQP